MKRHHGFGAMLAAGAMLAVSAASAQFPAPPGGPEDPATALPTLQDLANRLVTGADADLDRPGYVEPAGPPGTNAMPTLNDLMTLMPAQSTNPAATGNVREGKVYWSLGSNQWGLATGTVPAQVVSPTNSELVPGFYDETVWSEVETNLVPEHVRQGVVILGVTGTAAFASAWPAPVAQTGWDGSPGVPWPEPRFVPGTNGATTNVVTDRLTGLMWLRTVPADQARRIDAMATIAAGTWGGYDDWRMPSIKEMLSLLDYSRHGPALPAGHPFFLTEAQSRSDEEFNTDTYIDPIGDYHFTLILESGLVATASYPDELYFWPVRGPDGED